MPADPLSPAFATVLRRLREERSMTQEDLAFESGVGRVAIAMMETGRRLPTLPTLFRLAGPLGVSPATVIERVSREVGEGYGSERAPEARES